MTSPAPLPTEPQSSLVQRASTILASTVALLSITLVGLALYLVFFNYRGNADEQSRAQILSIYRAIDGADAAMRPQIAAVLSDLVLAVEYQQLDNPAPNPLNSQLAEAVVRRISFRLNDGAETTLALRDGNAIRVSHTALTATDRPSLWITLGVLTLLLLFAVLLWSATRYLSPVQRVVDAADQLSLDRELSPIDEKGGPALARDAARAFNRMQSRIREYLSERSLMIHALHHDLRHGMFKLQMRMEQVTDSKMRDKGLRDISDLLEVLEEVLAFADTDTGPDRRQNIRINSVVLGAVDTFIDQGRDIQVDLTGPHTVYANQTRIKRAIGNVVGNAMAYADSLWVSSQVGEHLYTLYFDDDGPGIPAQDRDRVLQPFERLDSSRNRSSGGTGLGLAIVKRGIERDLGSLSLTDSPRGGLRIVLTIPRPSK